MGGAESAARQLAEHLVTECGWQVEVFTTGALDHITWDDVLSPGDSVLNGVTVHRFASASGRVPEFYDLDGRLRMAPSEATLEESRRWLELNGPVTPDLVDAVHDSDAEVIAFYPYLYYPTVVGMEASTAPRVLHPAAHDEPALYLKVFDATFADADAICYHTAAERRLVQRRHRVAQIPADRARPGRRPRRRRRAGGRGGPRHRGPPLRRERRPRRRAQRVVDARRLLPDATRRGTPALWPWPWSDRGRRRSPTTRTSSSPAR